MCTNLEDARAATLLTAIDYAKAFNRLSFQHCLLAFARKGASTELLRILATFLSNRTMSVRIGDVWSDPLPVYGGVPQGSILGVLLFNVATDDLEDEELDRRILVQSSDENDSALSSSPVAVSYTGSATGQSSASEQREDGPWHEVPDPGGGMGWGDSYAEGRGHREYDPWLDSSLLRSRSSSDGSFELDANAPEFVPGAEVYGSDGPGGNDYGESAPALSITQEILTHRQPLNPEAKEFVPASMWDGLPEPDGSEALIMTSTPSRADALRGVIEGGVSPVRSRGPRLARPDWSFLPGRRNRRRGRRICRRINYSDEGEVTICLLYTSPSPRDRQKSRMPSSA